MWRAASPHYPPGFRIKEGPEDTKSLPGWALWSLTPTVGKWWYHTASRHSQPSPKKEAEKEISFGAPCASQTPAGQCLFHLTA